MRLPLVACALAAAVVACAAQSIDPQTVGPRVGEAVPDFLLKDQHGSPRALESIFGPKGAVLVFFRSADW